MISESTVKSLIAKMKRNADYVYTFSNLGSPDWIGPLVKHGFFADPPPPIREGDYIRFPTWPESRYLARVADKDPEQVLKVALRIPKTENVRVHEDLAEAALAMPAKYAKKFVPRTKQWLRSRHFLLLPDKLGKLVSHLASGGETKAALELAQELLTPVKIDGDIETQQLRGPDLRFRLWEYDQITSKQLPTLAKAAPIETFELLVNKLDHAIELVPRSGRDGDGSYVWRELIPEARKHETDLRSLFVTAMRRTAVTAIKTRPENLGKLLDVLASHKPNIFLRFQMYLLEKHWPAEKQRVSNLLLIRENLNNIQIQNEYEMLLQKAFGSWSKNTQLEWLELIEQGPVFPRTVSEKDRRDYSAHWKRRRIAPVVNKLPNDWAKAHAQLIKGLRVPKDFRPFHISEFVHVGPNSPVKEDAIKKMTPAAVAKYLREWKPGEGHSEPSPEGLSRVLTGDVANRPSAYIKSISKFTDLDPTYVRGLLHGIREAIEKKGKRIDWGAVIELMSLTVKRTDKVEREWSNEESDPSWEWTRKTIADVLYAGLQSKAKKAGIPIGLRKQVWGVLKPLTDDRSPTPEREAEFTKSNKQAYDHLAINTVRGQAMNDLMLYFTWVQRHLVNEDENHVRTFKDAPEAQEVLEAHLDRKRDPSLTIRSIYGQWSPWMQQGDLEWFVEHADQIFPLDPSSRDYWRAAWLPYINHNNAFPAVYVMLRKHYAHALEPSELDFFKDESSFYQQRLAAHLVVFYLSGAAEFGDKDGVLEKFFTNASDQMRHQAIDFAGESLGTIKELDGAALEDRKKRLISLWERRLAAARKNPDQHREELAAFGQWFIAGGLDQDWLESNLIEVLKLTGKIEPEYRVVEHLVSIAPKRPRRAIEILELVIDNPKNEWSVEFWRESAHQVLEKVLDSKDDSAVSAARNLVQRLGAMGHQQFRDLAKK